MSPGKACRHCTAAGCAIYENRPQEPCRSFVCAWLQPGSPLPEDMRPDRCGAIVVFDKKCLGIDVFVAAPVGARIPEATLRRLMVYAQRIKKPLLYWENVFDAEGRLLEQRQTGFGPPDFAAAVQQAKGPIELMSA